MKSTQDQIMEGLSSRRLLLVALLVTLGFFLHKGITYALIGSYFPLVIIVVVLGLFLYSMFSSRQNFVRVIGLWSIMLMLWSGIRMVLSIVNMFVKPIPEGHVSAQLGISGLVISSIFLMVSVYIWKKRNLY